MHWEKLAWGPVTRQPAESPPRTAGVATLPSNQVVASLEPGPHSCAQPCPASQGPAGPLGPCPRSSRPGQLAPLVTMNTVLYR